MVAEKLSQGEVARRVGVGVDVVGRWLKEAHRPRGDLATTIETKFGIPASWWWAEPLVTEAPVDPDVAATVPVHTSDGAIHVPITDGAGKLTGKPIEKAG